MPVWVLLTARRGRHWASRQPQCRATLYMFRNAVFFAHSAVLCGGATCSAQTRFAVLSGWHWWSSPSVRGVRPFLISFSCRVEACGGQEAAAVEEAGLGEATRRHIRNGPVRGGDGGDGLVRSGGISDRVSTMQVSPLDLTSAEVAARSLRDLEIGAAAGRCGVGLSDWADRGDGTGLMGPVRPVPSPRPSRLSAVSASWPSWAS